MTTIKDKVKAFLKELREKNGGSEDNLQNEELVISIGNLMLQIEGQFKEVIKTMSAPRIVQFPMVFEILLCPHDYELLKQGIPGMLPNLIADFYGIIKDKLKKSGEGADYNASNKYWQFSFSACEFIRQNGEEIEITSGRYITLADLYAIDIRDTHQVNGDGYERRTRKSVKDSRNSLTGMAINLEILRGGAYLSNNTFVFDFDPDLSQELKTIRKAKSKKELASIEWFSDTTSKKSLQPFKMLESTITISGPKENRDNPSCILKIDDASVDKDHVQIHYLEAKDEFQICAFADGVRVDEVVIPVSQGQNMNWRPLNKRAEIIIRDAVTIKFKAL